MSSMASSFTMAENGCGGTWLGPIEYVVLYVLDLAEKQAHIHSRYVQLNKIRMPSCGSVMSTSLVIIQHLCHTSVSSRMSACAAKFSSS